MKKYKYQIYILLFFALCLIPSFGLFFTGPEESSENRETAQMPQLYTEEGMNVHFLNDTGKWFEEHFAFRNEWVSSYALLMEKVFGVSSQERVIVGKDGWLYYKDSLDDFQGANQMTERQLYDVAHSMAMIQAYAKKNGADFAFTIAPNKNSLYGSNMPYYYQNFRTKGSNRERLLKYLKRENVHYVDLYEVFSSKGQVLYHKRDSHWNNEGASVAADAILTTLEKEHPSYTERKFQTRKDFFGDLNHMLYPAFAAAEEEIYYDPLPEFSYCGEVSSNFEPKISTEAKAGEGSLVMYRDSFGNALLPYMAEVYKDAYFSRGIPYYLFDLAEHGADTLVIERAERFLPDMAKEAANMEAPMVQEGMSDAKINPDIKELQVVKQGESWKVTGVIPDDCLKTESKIYIKVNGKAVYEAFPVSCEDGQEGFSMFLGESALQDGDNQFELYLE